MNHEENYPEEYYPAENQPRVPERVSGAERTENILKLVQANSALIQQGLDVASQITEVYAESQRLDAQVAMTEKWSQVEMAKTAAKFYATRELIERTFGEREKALSAHYRALDHALESGDREVLLAAMQQISNIVTSSPLEEIQEFNRRYNDPTANLLDW